MGLFSNRQWLYQNFGAKGGGESKFKGGKKVRKYMQSVEKLDIFAIFMLKL